MDNIGDLLYLVLMVGVAVFSLVRKNREKGDHTTSTPSRVPQDDTTAPEWDNWVDDEEVESVKPEIASPVPSKPYKTVEKTVFTYDSPDQAQPGRSVFKHATPANWEVEQDEEGDFFGGEPFDLRKAVLYSEVLKRPVW